jgi:methionine-gamma-lyase
MKTKGKGFSSTAIHAGKQKENFGAHVTPIYTSSTYVYDSAEQGMNRFTGKEEGYIYSRWGNPTITEAEEKIAALETFSLTNKQGEPLAAKALLHASGMAAITTLILSNVQAGQKILTHYSLYGGTEEFFSKILPSYNLEIITADLFDPINAEAAFAANDKISFVYLETPANPTCSFVPIEALTRIAHKHGAKVGIDNTFATPYLQQPFAFGVDFIIHSTTKFLNGHGTAIGGIVLGTDVEFMKTKVTKWHRLLGGNSNGFDAYQLINGLKTLSLRMDVHCANAQAVAEYLATHPKIEFVNYPGLPTHKFYELAKLQMKHAGALLSFEIKGGLQKGIDFINKLNMCVRTVSLGTCDTLISHPASMTHYGVAEQQRLKYGITNGLMRMSVGIENLEDIIEDLSQALDKI